MLLNLQVCCYYWLQESNTYQVRVLSSAITHIEQQKIQQMALDLKLVERQILTSLCELL